MYVFSIVDPLALPVSRLFVHASTMFVWTNLG